MYDLTHLWLSIDPLTDHPNQIDKSPYAAFWNNPVKYNDPDGRCPVCEEEMPDAPMNTVYRPEGSSLDWVKGADGQWTGLGGTLPGITVTPSGNYIEQKLGGMPDFSNSSIALTLGGAVYGAMEGATAGNGYWLGQNGKYYTNMTGRGPNQYTGSRTAALNSAKTYRVAGKATIAGSVLLGGYQTYEGYAADGGEFGYNAQSAAFSSAGSIAGGIAGAKGGALIGAGIGAWFGGVGAIPGAVVGGFIGGIGGSIGGGFAGQSAVDYYHGR